MDSYKREELRRRHRAEKLDREREAREAPRKAIMARQAAAEAEALAALKANPDYVLIVEYLAACSEDEVPHLALDRIIEDVQELGCTLTDVKIKRFLENNLKLKTWVHKGKTLCMVPHGWTRERGEYPLDVDGVWAKWIWIPGPQSEWSKDDSS